MPEDVTVERIGNRVHARIPYMDGKGPEFAKRVIGARWSPSTKTWTYPLDIEVCRRLREVFGKHLRVGVELAEWAQGAIRTENHAIELAGFNLAEPVALPNCKAHAPTMWAAMQNRGFQTVAAEYARTIGNCIIADEPGLGKTLETFGAIVESGITGRILVAAPKTSLLATWGPEIEKWMADVEGGVNYMICDGTQAERERIIGEFMMSSHQFAYRYRYNFLLINPEMLHTVKARDCSDEFECSKKHAHSHHKFPTLFASPWNMVVGDEVHKYLMNANPRAKSVSQVGMGFQRLPVVDALLTKLALSGTPMKGKPRNLWGTLHWLRPDLYPSQWRWSMMYFKTEDDAYAYSGKKLTDELLPDREPAFNKELSRIMIRRTKSELRKINPAWAPPDKQYIEIWLPMEGKQLRQYRAMEKSSSVQLEGGTLNATGILAEFTRLKQFAGCSGKLVPTNQGMHFQPEAPSNKVDWLINTFLPERGITGKAATDDGEGKVVVASQFTQFIHVISAQLDKAGIGHLTITGETNMAKRVVAQQRFQQVGGPRVFLINTNAGGVSITLDAADDCVIMDETWVPDEQTQVEDRVHRTSRTDHQVNIYYVRSKGSIEEEIASIVELKDENQKRVLDGRRGVEYARTKYNVPFDDPDLWDKRKVATV